VNSSVPLGVLPDGGKLYWMQCDPNSLYIRSCSRDIHDARMNCLLNILKTESKSERKNYRRIIENDSGKKYLLLGLYLSSGR